jgi:hypothetical protein
VRFSAFKANLRKYNISNSDMGDTIFW